MVEYNSKNPYYGEMIEKRVITHPDSTKETRHISFDLGKSGLEYKVGDALGIIPQNPNELVSDLMGLLNFNGSEMIVSHLGEATVEDALTNHYEIHRLCKKFIQGLEMKFSSSSPKISARLVGRSRTQVNSGESAFDWDWSGDEEDYPEGFTPVGAATDPTLLLWESLVNDADAMEDYLWSRDYIDLLSDMPNLSFTPQEFVSNLDRLKPRLYSIASSPDAHPGEVELTVGIVRYNHHGRDRGGLCTIYMADLAALNEKSIPMFMSPTRSFVLPKDGDTDIIMVGPGTGIAPFRAFLEQREMDKSKGRNWFFFGDRTSTHEYLYEEELNDWVDSGHLTRLDLAWSRMENIPKTYVQNLMAQNGEEIWSWIDGGAYFYVCGDKNRMAKDVHNTLINICQEFGNMSAEDAKEFVEKRMMKEEKRYLRDVY
jgi:sulfite reductase (NADPH) flavoprotein alpha-component